MRAATPEEVFNGDHFFNYASDTIYKVETLGTVTEIKIPTNIAAALNDKLYSYQWRMAIQSELQRKFALRKATTSRPWSQTWTHPK